MQNVDTRGIHNKVQGGCTSTDTRQICKFIIHIPEGYTNNTRNKLVDTRTVVPCTKRKPERYTQIYQTDRYTRKKPRETQVLQIDVRGLHKYITYMYIVLCSKYIPEYFKGRYQTSHNQRLSMITETWLDIANHKLFSSNVISQRTVYCLLFIFLQ